MWVKTRQSTLISHISQTTFHLCEICEIRGFAAFINRVGIEPKRIKPEPAADQKRIKAGSIPDQSRIALSENPRFGRFSTFSLNLCKI
jgi:hypothetical protein